MRRFTSEDAWAHGHNLVLGDPDEGGRYVPECVDSNEERCWTFAVTTNPENAIRDFIEHAAEQSGVCWACSQPEAEWPNREKCERCWVMYHAKVHRLWPRDCPPFPGDPEDGERDG